MSIAKLIRLAQAHLTTLNGQRLTAETLGNLEEIERLDGEIAQTEATIQTLLTLA